MKSVHLRVDYLKDPLGLGNAKPEFSWKAEGGIRQSAYWVRCERDGELLWDSGKVESGSMTHILYAGLPLRSRDRVEWSVTLWDENGQWGESSRASFEMGLLEPADWTARWIAGDYKPKKNTRYPADLFRKEFVLESQVLKARLYASARGVYDVWINGERIEDWILAPGSTDYRHRIQYQTYDVTRMLKEGNTLVLRLADGWYRGSCAAYGVTEVYGNETSVIAQLEIEMADGTCRTVVTDGTWNWCCDGPIRFADLQDGEIYDARYKPSYNGRARETAAPKKAVLVSADNVAVREQERFTPVLHTAADGTRVLDFGQNMAGYLRFTVHGREGETFRLTLGEILGADGHVDMSNIRLDRPAKGWNPVSLLQMLLTNKVSGAAEPTPKQEIAFTCSGGEDIYKTSFAVFGFRYVQIDGELDVDSKAFEAIAVYSDMEETGDFSCSNEDVNRLVRNTRWSMKSNFLDVPTDCPTRERLGWTGDAQIFYDTGAYLMNTAPFFRKWLRDMEDAQYANGLLPAVLPYNGVEMMYKSTGSSVGWADAVYLIPYRQYLRYGDRKVLEQSWPMIRKYADYLLHHLGLSDRRQAKANLYNDYTYEKGVHLGEWLEPEEFRDQQYGAKAKHPEECTAYFCYAMRTCSAIARLLGEDALAEDYRAYADGALRAYEALFVRTGTLDTDRQAKLVRPLALGLLDGEDRMAAEQRLLQAVENYRYRVGTGFLSTPFLLPVLTAAGQAETAYQMLLNEEKPGWLYEIRQGATTVWESWEGDVSRNHYSPGAVCQWLFDTAAGIRVAGENRFVIAPVPGGGLTYAGASYDSLYGRVESRWEQTEGRIHFTVKIPANTEAVIRLPDGTERTVTAGTYEYTIERTAA